MKKISPFVAVIIVLTAFLLKNEIRDSLVRSEVETASFGNIGIEKMDLQRHEDSNHLRVYCKANEKLPLSVFESASDDEVGFSPLPENGFVIHIISNNKPHFLEKIAIPVTDKTTKEIVFKLTTRFWPKNVNQAG